MATTGSLSPGLPLFFYLWLFLLKQRDVAGFRHLTVLPWWQLGFPGGSDGKESACKVGDPDSIPGAGRSPGEGKGYPLQYSCLVIPGYLPARGNWKAAVHGVAKSRT